ncbi:MAG: DUF5606 domain-containing protein [Saprospiraceae bacterium]|nr:DUF5606 domain-containing protein [Saprospiraceae bacterium]
MNLDKFLVIAGVPGVHKLVSTRSNGLVIEDRQEGRTRFVPVRQQQVTPLATIAIYTDTEEGTVTLTDVFQKMLDQLETNPPVASDSNSAQFRAYFTAILPEHDQERVHINDIKKCIKWFNFMIDKGIFEEVKKEAELAETEATADAETNAEVAAPETETTSETPETEA